MPQFSIFCFLLFFMAHLCCDYACVFHSVTVCLFMLWGGWCGCMCACSCQILSHLVLSICWYTPHMNNIQNLNFILTKSNPPRLILGSKAWEKEKVSKSEKSKEKICTWVKGYPGVKKMIKLQRQSDKNWSGWK